MWIWAPVYFIKACSWIENCRISSEYIIITWGASQKKRYQCSSPKPRAPDLMVLDWGPSIITVLSISLVSPLWGQGYGHRAFKDLSKSQKWPFLNYEVLILPWKMLFCITQASHEQKLLIYKGKRLAGRNNFMPLLMFMGHNRVGCVLVSFRALTQAELASNNRGLYCTGALILGFLVLNMVLHDTRNPGTFGI